MGFHRFAGHYKAPRKLSTLRGTVLALGSHRNPKQRPRGQPSRGGFARPGDSGAYLTLRKGDESMWIVRLALRRTYTFVVVALLIAVLGAVSIYRMSTDIFPNIDIPVVSVVWSYTGMPAEECE